MIAPKKILVETHCFLVNLIPFNGVLYQNLVFLVVTFSVSVSTLFLALVRFVKKLVFFFFSGEGNKSFQMCDSTELISHPQEDFQSDSVKIESVAEKEETEDAESDMIRLKNSDTCEEETENSESDMIRLKNSDTCEEETENSESDMIQLKNSDTCEEETSKLIFKFEFQTKTFEHFLNGGRYEGEDTDRFLDPIASSPIENNHETKPLNDVISCVNDDLEDASLCSDRFLFEEDFLEEKSVDVKSDAFIHFTQEEKSTNPSQKFPDEFQFLSEEDFIRTTSSDSGTIDGFFSDSDFEEEEEEEHSDNCEQKEAGLDSNSDQEDDCNGLESLWEHQDLIEQMKMELRKVKATGLPTILEDESESGEMMEGLDLKPWKIDEKKFQQVDTIGELHKFYKSYRERMRKLDILNYQKMYAIGLLQSKDQFHAISMVKTSSSPTVGSVIASNLWLCKPRKPKTDPVEKFMKELQSELEQVYVGQLCLSWEILHWQYEKAIELWESDPYAIHCYNEVAAEFQQFQVLIQRFLENEEFEGPRVQNYAKKRCVLRNLLQVPVIREDRNKKRADDAVTSDKLLEMMEESIRVFWNFVRADKHMNSNFEKTRTKSQIQPEDSEGLEMFAEIKSALQKKEKKLKDVVRSGNCILRKFKKHGEEEDGSEQVLVFFSQVDMKLVTRVLNMSELTRDHLIWCHSKLNKISFVNRRIHVEPSFCLFPC